MEHTFLNAVPYFWLTAHAYLWRDHPCQGALTQDHCSQLSSTSCPLLPCSTAQDDRRWNSAAFRRQNTRHQRTCSRNCTAGVAVYNAGLERIEAPRPPVTGIQQLWQRARSLAGRPFACVARCANLTSCTGCGMCQVVLDGKWSSSRPSSKIGQRRYPLTTTTRVRKRPQLTE